MSIIIRHRLRAKTAPQHTQTLVQEFVLGEEAPADSKLMVYLITFAHPKKALSADGYVPVASSASTKTEIMAKVLDACYNPDSRNPANAESVSVDINRSGVWRGWHKQGDDGQWHQHDHVPVLAFGSFRYLAVKRALLKRHGCLCVPASALVPGSVCWSACVYLCVSVCACVCACAWVCMLECLCGALFVCSRLLA